DFILAASGTRSACDNPQAVTWIALLSLVSFFAFRSGGSGLSWRSGHSPRTLRPGLALITFVPLVAFRSGRSGDPLWALWPHIAFIALHSGRPRLAHSPSNAPRALGPSITLIALRSLGPALTRQSLIALWSGRSGIALVALLALDPGWPRGALACRQAGSKKTNDSQSEDTVHRR